MSGSTHAKGNTSIEKSTTETLPLLLRPLKLKDNRLVKGILNIAILGNLERIVRIK